MKMNLRIAVGAGLVVSTVLSVVASQGCAPTLTPPVIAFEPTSEWRTYAGGNERQFFNSAESTITAANVSQLTEVWRFQGKAIITGSPTVANVTIPGEGVRSIAFIQDWGDYDENVGAQGSSLGSTLYAIRVRDGSELWRFDAKAQNVSFPGTSSVHVEQVGGQERVLFGTGERFYSLDAVTGLEIWHFDTGTGCGDPANPDFANSDCDYAAERNQIESSAIVADGKIFFGMDVDDDIGGKGGFYALDVNDGRLAWFFDLESGMTCTPNPGDNIRRYDGYHTEVELGLPSGFLASRPGCNHPRNPNGCGNVWSSAAIDLGRQEMYFASSNCDTDSNPATLEPPSQAPYTPANMPAYDEALVALDFNGIAQWKWRPREIDNDDLAFGGVPNLFQITVTIGVTPTVVDVVGIGNKDGTYYVVDRDGVNQVTGVSHLDANANLDLPYWQTKVVTGGTFSGIIATAAVDEAQGRIYFTTPYQDIASPQSPNVHALDMNTGAVIWQVDKYLGSFAPTSAIPGVVFGGSVFPGSVFGYDAATGGGLFTSVIFANTSVASASVVVDGILIVGGGIGSRHAVTGAFPDDSTANSTIPNSVIAFCVPGTPICQQQ